MNLKKRKKDPVIKIITKTRIFLPSPRKNFIEPPKVESPNCLDVGLSARFRLSVAGVGVRVEHCVQSEFVPLTFGKEDMRPFFPCDSTMHNSLRGELIGRRTDVTTGSKHRRCNDDQRQQNEQILFHPSILLILIESTSGRRGFQRWRRRRSCTKTKLQ